MQRLAFNQIVPESFLMGEEAGAGISETLLDG